MARRLFILMIISVLSLSVFAQSAVVPAGGTANGSGGSVSYTVGQIADQKMDGGGRYMIEGVQQPYEIQVVGVNIYPDIDLSATVYPNPTADKLILSIKDFEIPSAGLTLQLFDLNGKQLKTMLIEDAETEIDFSGYAAATYQLRVVNGKQLMKTFKVVKSSL
ncbi:MAG: T9SS type A sorting domain-containing protein [Bacteroidales bacterium]|nr:T9SS type A sorting domain-containing protein [Bacteroidales bacterium]